MADRRGSIATGTTSAVRSFSVTLAQAPVLGNVLQVGIGFSKGSSSDPAITESSGTWTLLGKVVSNTTTTAGGLYVFGKVATSAEVSAGTTGPSFSASSNTTFAWEAVELEGLDTTSFPLAPAAPATYNAVSSGGTQTASSNAITTTKPNEFVYTFAGGRGTTSDMSLSFGGGVTQDQGQVTGSAAWIASAFATVATSGTTLTPTVTLTNGQGGPVDAIGSVAYAPVAPNSGTVAGGVNWASSTTGSTAHSGTVSKTVNWASSTTGSTAHSGTISKTVSWASSTTGTTSRSGHTSGTVSWASATSGSSTHSGTTSSTVSWASATSGTTPPISPNSGTVAGGVKWASATSGTSLHSGSTAGAVNWASVTSGTASHSGTAAGTLRWAASLSGSTPHSGTAAGTVNWASATSGTTPPPGGVIAGGVNWASTTSGRAEHSGQTSGTLEWSGAVSGSTQKQGQTAGTVLWTAHITGFAPSTDVDWDLRYSLGQDRWKALLGEDRWRSLLGEDRWASTITPEG